MTKTEAEAMYATAVREALGREFDAWEVEMMRELWDEDVDAREAAQEIEHAAEQRWMQHEPDPELIGGRGHLIIER